MKKLIFILLSIQFCLLSAADGDQLDLGNVVIQGETESLEDTVGSERDLTEYCAVASPEEFEYSAYFSPGMIESPSTYPIQKIAALQFKGGLANFTGMNGVLSAGDVWNFSADFLQRERSDDWQEKTYNLHWQPEIKEHKFMLDFSNKEFTSQFRKTKISGGYLSYNRDDFQITQLPNIYWQLDLKGAYTELTQLQASADDFDLTSKIGVKYNNLFGDVSVNLLKQKASGYIDAGFSNFIFDELGFWFAYDEEGVYPSISLSSKIHLIKNLGLRLENKPVISTSSRADGFNENLLQDIFAGDMQTKKILNSFVSLESDFIFPVSIYYNANLERDHLLSSDIDANGYYEQENLDCFIQKIGVQAAYKYGDLTLIQNVEYKTADEQLYFEPLLVASTKLEFNRNSYRFGIDLQFFRDGVDDNDQDLDDSMLLDISALYKLRENISLMAEARNLLNQEYQKYTNYSAEELQLIFGVKMTF